MITCLLTHPKLAHILSEVMTLEQNPGSRPTEEERTLSKIKHEQGDVNCTKSKLWEMYLVRNW